MHNGCVLHVLCVSHFDWFVYRASSTLVQISYRKSFQGHSRPDLKRLRIEMLIFLNLENRQHFRIPLEF